jgi:hemin uptake protein HemP
MCSLTENETELRLDAETPAHARVDSKDLLRGQRELLIVHNGREYRLRLTQNGKLILTA